MNNEIGYMDIFRKVYDWMLEGKIWPEWQTRISFNSWGEFDIMLTKFLNPNNEDWENFRWLLGPHGLTLLKAKIIIAKNQKS